MAEVTQYPTRSGRRVRENGDVYNIAEMLAEMGGAEPLDGVNAQVTQYPMQSGRLVGENGNVYNEVDLIGGIRQVLENVYLRKTGGALTGDVTTSVTTFTSTSLVTRQFVEDAIANITDYESEVFPNG